MNSSPDQCMNFCSISSLNLNCFASHGKPTLTDICAKLDNFQALLSMSRRGNFFRVQPTPTNILHPFLSGFIWNVAVTVKRPNLRDFVVNSLSSRRYGDVLEGMMGRR